MTDSQPNLRLAALTLVALGLASVLVLPTFEASPTVTWHVDGQTTGHEPFGAVEARTPIELEIDLPTAAHVYVVGFDFERGSVAMYPSQFLRSDVPAANPMPAGKHRLPGRGQDLSLHWSTGDATGVFTTFVLVSDRALPELETAMKTFRQAGNAAFPGRAELGLYAPEEGGMEIVPPRHRVPTSILAAALDDPDATTNGPMHRLEGHDGVWLKVFRAKNPDRLPPEQIDADTLHDRIDGDLRGRLEGALRPGGDEPRSAGPPK